MSRPKPRNVLLSGNSLSAAAGSTYKDELLQMKYVMDKPAEPVYPLAAQSAPHTYPDFRPWAEDDAANAKLATAECLNSGFYESPSVANEYFSARGLVQETLMSSDANGLSVLQELSLNLTRAYKVRNDAINKISNSSHAFKLPPRVTLTAAKRDAWLRDLASPDVPLSQVATKIPHGIRNKVLLDHLCSSHVPISRAVWFVKCVLCSEQQLLRKKFSSRQNQGVLPVSNTASLPSLDIIESRWLQEWTSQVADYVARFSREMPSVNSPEKNRVYSAKLGYLLRLVETLYIELLLDRAYFLSCVVRSLRDEFPFKQADLPELVDAAKSEADDEVPFVAKILAETPVNYGLLLATLTLIKTFWREILQQDFLCKSLGEALLLHCFLVERIPTYSAHSNRHKGTGAALPLALKENLYKLISSSVADLFRHNSNAFILPEFWPLTGELLYRILDGSSIAKNGESRQNFEAVFRLINYRNESLMLNLRYMAQAGPKDESGASYLSQNNNSDRVTPGSFSSPLTTATFTKTTNTLSAINRSSEDPLLFIEHLDAMNLKSTFASSLRPHPTSSGSQKWRTNVNILVRWCASSSRDMGPSAEKVLTLCNYIKRKVLQPLPSRGNASLKAEFESEIFDSIFALAFEPSSTLCMHNLFVLINELYQLKIISISSYLRKIIACGIFYISSSDTEMQDDHQKDPQIPFHLSILSNLPVLNNKQQYQILSKWTSHGEKISSSYNRGMEIAKSHFLDCLGSEKYPAGFNDFLIEIDSFSVGVKFLLASWLTTQTKNSISQSPKLIHVSPSTVARFYKFYTITDNLTVFFKAFIKFILRNEDKVIIFYLDTLDFIGRLVRRHYLMVNFLPGNSADRLSATYELYNLILHAYLDLSSREPDLYNFKFLWEFMNQSVDIKVAEPAGSRPKSREDDLEKYIYNKETAESPLKVQVPTPRRNQAYAVDIFMEHLVRLLSTGPQRASLEDVQDYCQEIGSEHLTVSPQEIYDGSKSLKTLHSLLQEWKSSFSKLDEQQASAFFKLVKVTLDTSRDLDSKHIVTFLSSGPCQNVSDDVKFFVTLVTFRLISLNDALRILETMPTNLHESDLNSAFFKMIFGDDELNSGLLEYEKVSLMISQSEFRSTNLEKLFHLVIQELESVSALDDSKFWMKYCKLAKETIMSAVIQFRAPAFAIMTTGLAAEVVVDLCRQLLLISNDVSSIMKCTEIASMANEFTLPVLQLLFRTVTSQEHPSQFSINEAMSSFFAKLQFPIDTNTSYFGELFNFLEWNEKSKVFESLETHFLTLRAAVPVFDAALDGHFQVYMFAGQTLSGVEHLALLKDFFKKFIVSSSERLDLSVEKFQQFADMLSNINQLVANIAVVQSHARQLHDIISIFLRLLIIHSTSLTKIISVYDSVNFEFLRSMMVLLNSAFLASGEEKLKILLFDLLFQIKSSLTQCLVAPRAEEAESTTAQVLGTKPDLSPAESSLDTAGGTAAVMTMSMILNLPEPGMAAYDLGPDDRTCSITLDDEEINHSSEAALANNQCLVVRSKAENEDPFGHSESRPAGHFGIESVSLIEDTSSGINNGCISLSMFGAYLTKENPY